MMRETGCVTRETLRIKHYASDKTPRNPKDPVLLERHGRGVRTIIEDDGIGFDPDKALNGECLGLYGIRERAELLNGTLTIESNPKRGTTIFVEVPV